LVQIHSGFNENCDASVGHAVVLYSSSETHFSFKNTYRADKMIQIPHDRPTWNMVKSRLRNPDVNGVANNLSDFNVNSDWLIFGDAFVFTFVENRDRSRIR